MTDYGGGERRREVYVKQETLLDKWLTPTALTLVLGGIVWGVQLNFAVKQLADAVGEARGRANRAELRVDVISENVLRSAVILERLEKRIEKLEHENADFSPSGRK